MKKALLLGMALSLTVLGLATCSMGGAGTTVVSTWGGSYVSISGGNGGSVSGWKFMSDKTTTGVWNDSTGAVSINIDAGYALNGSTLTIAASGTATRTLGSPTASPYSLTCSGYLGGATGNGVYNITFSAWGTSDSGTWAVVKQ